MYIYIYSYVFNFSKLQHMLFEFKTNKQSKFNYCLLNKMHEIYVFRFDFVTTCTCKFKLKCANPVKTN